MKKMSKVFLTAVAAIMVMTTGLTAEAKSTLKGKITINGSTALLPLTQQAAKEFRTKNPGVTIAASGKGSVTGPQSVEKGIADIGACDWDASTDVPGFKKFTGQVANKVAAIPFAAVVNNNVSVSNLTTQQLKDIFSGKIKNWKEVGGQDGEIVIINRAFGSGTRVNFQMKALENGDINKRDKNYKEVGSSGEMKTNVANTKNAIGFLDLVYVNSDLKALKINDVEASPANVINGTYKVWSYGYYMTKGQPTGVTKAFIDYVQSSDFQQGSVKKMKFIPLNSIKK
ncbi:phosphate ABC transporter substrate-binding protein [Gorillibacterium massiliense]|uniref:phosphate ABC transporter substrate-binding protein n=1 Tax=Gorillibacterium massiliense TaxID=1280390 RepID=UPI0004AC5C98|nr:phosphate ABC transporter substrate-binding protein [Gorillibacterium massiliense]